MSRQSGFTLLEVLVAFSITAMALGVVFQIFGKGSTALVLGDEYAEAVAIAESRLAEWSVGPEGQVARSGSDGRYGWQVDVSDYGDAGAAGAKTPLELKQLAVEVRWESRGQTRVVKLQTLKPVVSS